MTCPYHADGEGGRASDDGTGVAGSNSESQSRSGSGSESESGALDRRGFLRSALAVGGASALSTVTGLFGWPETAGAESTATATDGVTVAERLNRQHAWDDYTERARGTAQVPEYHLLLFLDYEESGEPTAEDRKRATAAFDRLEETFEWSNDGLLFTVSYSMGYFDRFEASLPAGLRPDNGTPIPRMLTAQQIIDGWTVPNPFDRTDEGVPKPFELRVTRDDEDPVADDDYDAVVHLASDHVQHLLAAEGMLWGEDTTPEGVDSTAGDATLTGVFTKPTSYPERRTGFVGNDALEEEIAPAEAGEEGSQSREEFEEAVSDGAELSFGYNDIYRNSNPREDNVTMLEDQRFLPGNPQPPGVFAGGSILHVSKLDSDLEGWYGENDDAERRHRMFSPHHDETDVGDVGENLGESNAPTESTDMPMRDLSDATGRDVAGRTQQDVEEGRVIGHAQKVARARAQLEAHFQPEGDRSLPETGIPLQDDPVTAEREDDLAGHDGRQTAEAGFLRRDFNTTDDGGAGTHFVALQAFSIYLVYMRHAMNTLEWDTGVIGQPRSENTPEGAPAPGFVHEGEVELDRNGILEYIETLRRGNFVMPPLTQRALPPARALRPDLGVERDGGEFRVTLDGAADDLVADLDRETLRFGYYRAVNAGSGASLDRVERDDGGRTLVFDATETELNRDTVETPARVRLYGERETDRQPVFATATVDPATGESVLERRFDVDDDGEVDFEDVLAIIEARNEDGHEAVGFEDVLAVVEEYNEDRDWTDV